MTESLKPEEICEIKFNKEYLYEMEDTKRNENPVYIDIENLKNQTNGYKSIIYTFLDIYTANKLIIFLNKILSILEKPDITYNEILEEVYKYKNKLEKLKTKLGFTHSKLNNMYKYYNEYYKFIIQERLGASAGTV